MSPRLTSLALIALLSLTACGGEDDPSPPSTDLCQGRCLANQVCDQGQCVACISNAHCTSSAAPYCRPADNICVQCVDESHCDNGEVCQNAQCVPGSTSQDECSDDLDCAGESVCEEGACQPCRIGTCNLAGDSKCQAATIGGSPSWTLCPSGACDNGLCADVQTECDPERCDSGSARCTNEGKIENCPSGHICEANICKDPTSQSDCTPGQCANIDASCSTTGAIIACGSGRYCSANACVSYCGDGIVNNGEACDGANLNGKTCETLPGSSFTGGVLSCSSSCAFNTSGCTTIQQPSGIQTARDAVTGTTPAPVNINITNAVVTYVRPQQGNDDAGFFLQEGPTGPAIFVNANAGPDSPSVGDRISLTATEVVLKEVDRITAYSGYSKTGTVDLMSYYQDISEAADITTIDKYESELIVTFVTLTGDFDSLGSAGTGFKKAPIKTDGYIPTSPSRDFVLRIPTAMATAISAEAAALSKKVIGCEVYVEGLYWGYTTTTLSDTQLTIYEQDEELLVDCSNAENLPVIPEDWDYTETFSLITNVSNSYTVANNYTNNGITWIIKGRTLMTESATNYSLSEADGQGVILKKASEVEASGLMQGVSSIAFDYRMWSATTVVTIEFFNSAGDPLGTLVTETLNSTSKTTYHNPVTYSDVKKFKITASSDSRVIIDNVRWKNE